MEDEDFKIETKKTNGFVPKYVDNIIKGKYIFSLKFLLLIYLGYCYGETLIPISNEIKEFISYPSKNRGRELKLLQFTERKNVCYFLI